MRTTTASRPPVGLRKRATSPLVTELWITILPPPHIVNDISVLRDDIQYLIGHGFEGQRSLPAISLFRYKGIYGADLLKMLEARARLTEPFNIFLKDFGHLQQGESHTIYMDVINRFALAELVQQLTGETQEIFPHITLAQNLSATDFLACWPYLRSLHYGNQHFPCTHLTIFRKEGGRWVKETDIPLGSFLE